ncbi:hypothetical protein I4U23_011103 [Adineta vaga]|nr:hypothetical protein I4U23_011103 [Adineta vaga]
MSHQDQSNTTCPMNHEDYVDKPQITRRTKSGHLADNNTHVRVEEINNTIVDVVPTVCKRIANTVWSFMQCIANTVWAIMQCIANTVWAIMQCIANTVWAIMQCIANSVWPIIGPCVLVIVSVLIALGIIAWLLQYTYTVLICSQFTQYVPFLHHICSKPFTHHEENISFRANTVAEKTVGLAVFLTAKTDVSVPEKMVHMRTDIIAIRAAIDNGNIDPKVRKDLSEKFHDLQILIQQGGNQMKTMVNSFGTALAMIEKSTEYIAEDLKKTTSRNEALQPRDSQTSHTALVQSFNDYIASVRNDIKRAVSKANDAFDTLVKIRDILDQIPNIIERGKKLDNNNVLELEQDNLWRWIFGKDELTIAKLKRNLEMYDLLGKFVNEAANIIGIIIQKLEGFQHEIGELEYTAADLEEQVRKPHLQVGMQMKRLEGTLKQLKRARAAFGAKSDNKTRLE